MEWPQEWDFQEEDTPYFLSHLKSLVLYEPRLGKSVVTSKVLALDPKTTTILVTCSKNAFATWMEHIPAAFKKFAPNRSLDVLLIRGKNSGARLQREELWKATRTADVTVYIVTFNALINDYPFLSGHRLSFDTIIGDEVHTKLKRRTTKSAVIFRDLVRQARRFHALSGTLAGKWGPADYWTLLNMCAPREFTSYWKFVHMFCETMDNGFGMEIIGVRNRMQFHMLMDRFARIRKRKDVRPDMPEVVRTLQWVKPTQEQTGLYEALGESQFTFTESGSIIVAANSLESAIRKRQILACPRVLDPSLGVGAAMEDILEKIQEAKENDDIEGSHIVIFTAFRRAIPHWKKYLQDNGFPNVWELWGGTEPEELTAKIARFKETGGIILCTTKFAQAFSLSSAKLCYHIGYEYDPNDNRQAEDRLVPPHGNYSINSYYYGYWGTDDEILAERTILKAQLIHLTTTDPRKEKEKGNTPDVEN